MTFTGKASSAREDEQLQGAHGRGNQGDPGAWWSRGDSAQHMTPRGGEGATRGDPEGLVGSGDTPPHDTVARGGG